MTNVAIVGAGCAGLGAAYTLLQKSNANVWIFEALGRVGGRTWTYSPTLPVDLGAEAIEQPTTNPWSDIADMLNVTLEDADQDTLYRLHRDGTWSNTNDTTGIALVEATLKEGYDLRRKSPNRPILGSLHDWGESPPEMVSLGLASSGLSSIKESAEPWQFVAADMYRQEKEGPPPDGNPPKFAVGGIGGLVAQFADWLQQEYGERIQIHLNAPVARIDCESGNVTLATEAPFDSDYCIVTAPVSTILRIAFSPPLGYDQVEAYRNLKLGSYKKVGFCPTSAPAGEDEIELNKLYYLYDPELGGSWQYSWLPTNVTILVCVASGNFAARLDAMPDQQVLDRLVALLNRAYEGSDFTPSAVGEQEPEVAISNWTDAMYIRGAYSYTVYDGGPADDPVPFYARKWIVDPHERCYFAGEASWIPNYGTIAGAYLSGERAAKRLIQERGLPAG